MMKKIIGVMLLATALVFVGCQMPTGDDGTTTAVVVNGGGNGGSEQPAETTYTVTVSTVTNGTVTVDKSTAKAGETVIITIKPADGYELETISANNGAVTLIGSEATKQFAMPDSNVTITATFVEFEINNGNGDNGDGNNPSNPDEPAEQVPESIDIEGSQCSIAKTTFVDDDDAIESFVKNLFGNGTSVVELYTELYSFTIPINDVASRLNATTSDMVGIRFYYNNTYLVRVYNYKNGKWSLIGTYKKG